MANQMKMYRAIASALVTAFLAIAAVAQSPSNAWLDSPEATFMTNAERQEWWGLHTDAERDAFKERYWARRDPTPDTPKNEFRETLMQRIALADKKFTLDKKTRGSLTSRGQVYLVLGAPARVNVQQRGYNEIPSAPPPSSLLPSASGPPVRTSENVTEGNEITERWYYERTRTPKILDALGRPSLELVFVVEPTKQRDELQNPGLFNELHEVIAAKTVMNDVPAVKGAVPPTSVAPAAVSMPPVVPARVPVVAAPQMTPEIAAILDRAADAGTPLRSTVMWSGDAASVTFWLVAPEAVNARGPLAFYGRVKDSSGKTVATIARPLEASTNFSLRQAGAVAEANVPLVPGEYDASFLLNDDSTNTSIAAASGHVVVPERSKFNVSSLILSDRVDGASGGLSFGSSHVRPRADVTFTTAESLWYLFQVANPSDPAKVTVAVRLRHGIAPPTSPTVVPAALQSAGQGIFLSGFEMPLRELTPGDYTLYVSVHDPGGRDDVVRRADFHVVEAPRLQ